MAGRPRLALPGWSKLVLFVPHNASFLGTTTLEGPPQPNWCLIHLAAAIAYLTLLFNKRIKLTLPFKNKFLRATLLSLGGAGGIDYQIHKKWWITFVALLTLENHWHPAAE